MSFKAFHLLSVLASFSATVAHADGARVQNYTSSKGVTESCVALAPMPGAVYSEKDTEQENFFCSINVYDAKVAMCPKEKSTSPGTVIFDISESKLTQAQFESTRCPDPKKGAPKEKDFDKAAKFKNTMNAKGTSGTFSPASLLYYHFARYLNTDVKVPVAVYRTIDKEVHFARVSSKAKGQGKMNIAGWEWMRKIEKDPSAYNPVDEVFTKDRKQIYGILLHEKGERYGAEFNGTRASGWGDGQNNDFQITPGFLALRSEQPLEKAISEGINGALKDAKLKKDVGSSEISKQQMVFWMKELTEITLLDYIFSQQDRIGNIDYIWTWYYMENGKLKSKEEKEMKEAPRTKMASIKPPEKIASLNPILLQRSSIGDNDAGGRAYANFTKRTKMLEKIRHYSADTYRRLIKLDEDLKSDGPISQWLKSSFTLSDSQLKQIKTNTAEATEIIKATCAAGKLQFDLNPIAYLMGTAPVVEKVDCNNP